MIALATSAAALVVAPVACTDSDSGTGGSGTGGTGTGGAGGWECPTDQPAPKASCPSDSLVCYYGEEVCCGEPHPSFKCMCASATGWDCMYTDACLYPQCPDGGTGGGGG